MLKFSLPTTIRLDPLKLVGKYLNSEICISKKKELISEFLFITMAFAFVAGAGLEPATFGL